VVHGSRIEDPRMTAMAMWEIEMCEGGVSGVWDSCGAELRIEARMATMEGNLANELCNRTAAAKVSSTTARTRRPSTIVVLFYRPPQVIIFS
jgi:hypothetical protein